MERSAIRGTVPHYAVLHAGYEGPCLSYCPASEYMIECADGSRPARSRHFRLRRRARRQRAVELPLLVRGAGGVRLRARCGPGARIVSWTQHQGDRAALSRSRADGAPDLSAPAEGTRARDICGSASADPRDRPSLVRLEVPVLCGLVERY